MTVLINNKLLGFSVILTQLIWLSGCNKTMDVTASNETVTCSEASGETVELAKAKLYIEFNSTDDDIGVHGAFDGEAYSELCIYNPSGDQLAQR